MIVLAFDQSLTRTGWAVIEGNRLLATGSFASAGPTDAERLASFVVRVADLVSTHRPDCLVWEEPTRFIAGYPKRKPDLLGVEQGRWTVNARQLVLPALHGALLAVAVLERLPWDVVSAVAWRGAIFGTGNAKLARSEAKKFAQRWCRWNGYAAANEDIAEAVCIATWGATCSKRVKLEKTP